jgi:hypothetical protein
MPEDQLCSCSGPLADRATKREPYYSGASGDKQDQHCFRVSLRALALLLAPGPGAAIKPARSARWRWVPADGQRHR